MKTLAKRIHFRSTAGALILAGLIMGGPGPAYSQEEKVYAGVDLGAAWVQNADLQSYFTVPVAGSTIKFDPGFKLGLKAGYRVTPWFAAEFETGFSWSSIASISGANYVNADLLQTPVLANAVFCYRNRSKFMPWIGGGVGGASITLDADSISMGSGGNEVKSWGTASDFVFAYQGFAGVSYQVNRNISVNAMYRYFVAESPTFESDYLVNTTGNVRFGRLQSHVVTVGFTWCF
jgi:OmpA-OmpF porin, OOP family